MSKLAASSLLILTVALLCLFSTTCFVKGKCRTDVECDHPLVCNQEGACVLECGVDDDCELEEECLSGRCVPAVGCAGCAFDHADRTCVHGECTMGDCHLGWADGNDSTEDGCEYACTITGDEICDELDNDCDYSIDEGFDLLTDPAHCNACNHQCPTPDQAIPQCVQGACSYICEEGWFDNDGEPENGCEDDFCIPTGDEVCDGRDNNCDGTIDEGFDKTLPETCGPSCARCEYEHAEPLCVEGACEMGDCDDDWYDFDENPVTGCEEYCEYQGEEVCNGEDDDCSGFPDDGIVCCPDEMVAVENLFCIDIWEAHLQGEGDELVAASAEGVYPFWSRELRAEEAEGYCAAAGKRLCTAAEWVLVCRGPQDLEYCYGDDYEPTTCNGIDAFGEGNYHYDLTGSFETCTNGYGIFDINGNVWELTDDGQARGGAYNCRDSARLHACSFSIDPSRIIAIGFRCCK